MGRNSGGLWAEVTMVLSILHRVKYFSFRGIQTQKGMGLAGSILPRQTRFHGLKTIE